jgi:DNA polymerase-1
MKKKENWIVIDGFNLLYRFYYSIPKYPKENPPINILRGWIDLILKIRKVEKTNKIIFVFDSKTRTTWRRKIYPNYKKNRKKIHPKDFLSQIEIIKKFSKFCGYSIIEKKGEESDDLIASIVYILKKKFVVYIISTDRDFYQIIQKNVFQIILFHLKNKNKKLGKIIGIKEVIQELSILPKEIPIYLSLKGDSADNISGIPGVGKKTAINWIKNYGNFKSILISKNKLYPIRFRKTIESYKNLIKKNLVLVLLKKNINFLIKDILPKKPDFDKLYTLLKSIKFKNKLDKKIFPFVY